MKVCQNLTELDSAGIKAFFDSFDTVLCDCDGVLWLTQEAIPGSPEAIQKLKTMGKRVIFVTNNSNRTRNDYAIKFKNLGYEDITKVNHNSYKPSKSQTWEWPSHSCDDSKGTAELD